MAGHTHPIAVSAEIPHCPEYVSLGVQAKNQGWGLTYTRTYREVIKGVPTKLYSFSKKWWADTYTEMDAYFGRYLLILIGAHLVQLESWRQSLPAVCLSFRPVYQSLRT